MVAHATMPLAAHTGNGSVSEDPALRLVPVAKGDTGELGVGPALGYVREADLAFLRELLRGYAGQWVAVRFGAGKIVAASPDFASLIGNEKVESGDALYFVPENPDHFYSPDAYTQLMPPMVPMATIATSVDEDWIAQIRSELEPGLYLCYNNTLKNIVLPLQGATVRIGRSLGANIRFEDPMVSRRHALLICDDDEVVVLDDRSSSGVYLNGEKVQRHSLQDGDVITIGRYALYLLDLRG